MSNLKCQNHILNVKSFKILVVVLSFAFLVLSLASQSGALAQTSRSITAIPPRLEIKGEPGTTVQELVKFRNESDTEQAIQIITQDFIVEDTAGTPVFVESETSGRWSLASWMSIKPNKVLVAPKTSRSFSLIIDIPKDALPGGHYAGVIYTPAEYSQIGQFSAPQTGALGTAGNVGTLVYLTVAGPVTENAIIKRFSTPKFSEYGPIPFTTEIANNSDIHIQPQGVIKIKNMLDKEVVNLKLDPRNIFPGASYVYENVWNKQWLFGRYKASLDAGYGTGQVVSAIIFFWVIPWKLMAISLLAIAIIILLIKLIRKKMKKKEEKSLRQGDPERSRMDSSDGGTAMEKKIKEKKE